MLEDLYTLLAEPAVPQIATAVQLNDNAPQRCLDLAATHTEAIETTDNDRSSALLGSVNL
jgi:hypothetical protein